MNSYVNFPSLGVQKWGQSLPKLGIFPYEQYLAAIWIVDSLFVRGLAQESQWSSKFKYICLFGSYTESGSTLVATILNDTAIRIIRDDRQDGVSR